MSKTVLELQQEYTQACVQLGNLVYQNSTMARQIEANEQEADKLQKKMRQLSKEASDLQAEAAKAQEASSES